MSSFFIKLQVQAGIVEPVYKQFKNPNEGFHHLDPSPASIFITPDGKKMFVLAHGTGRNGSTHKKYYIYDLTTPFDLSTMDVANRTVVQMIGDGTMMDPNYL